MDDTKPGPIARETANAVIEKLSDKSISFKPIEPVEIKPPPMDNPMPITQAPGGVLDVNSLNIPKVFSPAWWFEKGGTTGIVCLIAVLSFWGISSSQKDGQDALIKQMQTSEKNRAEESKMVIQGVLRTQEQLTLELRTIGRTMEKIDARLEKVLVKNADEDDNQ